MQIPSVPIPMDRLIAPVWLATLVMVSVAQVSLRLPTVN